MRTSSFAGSFLFIGSRMKTLGLQGFLGVNLSSASLPVHRVTHSCLSFLFKLTLIFLLGTTVIIALGTM